MVKSTENKDFFEKAKGFLASYNQVLSEGFFTNFSVQIQGYEIVGTTHIDIRVVGFLPDDEKWKEVGVVSFIDPAKVIESIRQQLLATKCRMESSTCEVKMGDWLDIRKVKGEDKVVGKKGMRITLDLMVYLKPKTWIEK